MSRPNRDLLVLLVTGLAIVATGLIDRATGQVPDLTVFYIVPIAAAAYLSGLPVGLAAAALALAVELASALQSPGSPVGLVVVDEVFNFLVFTVAVLAVDRLLAQLRSISALEQARSADLEIARTTHEAFLPSPPREWGDLEIGSRLRYVREIGGDYYRFAARDGNLFFCIGDIAGKAISAALLTALLHAQITIGLAEGGDAGTLLRSANRRLHEMVPSNVFVTLFAAIIDAEGISYVNAGHEPPLLAEAAGGISHLTSETVPLGVLPDPGFPVERRRFAPGDTLLCVTDGVTESPAFIADAGRRLRELLSGRAGETPQAIADAVLETAAPDEQPLRDDAAIICIRRRGAAG